MRDNAIWRWLGCAIALLAAGGCEQLFQVEGAPRHDASTSDGLIFDVHPPFEDASGGHDEDGDGYIDDIDYCPSDISRQDDTDGDKIGDECDENPGQPDKRAFFDPLVAPVLGGWMATPGDWAEGADGDSVSALDTTGLSATATRALAAGSGSVVAWVESSPMAVSGTTWGVLLSTTPNGAITPDMYAGCYVAANGTEDDLYISAAPDGTGIPLFVGTIPGVVGHPIRIEMVFDNNAFISCGASRDGGAVIPIQVSWKDGAAFLALFASAIGPTFDSVLVIEPVN